MVRASHLRVQQFYNALDFADLILIAAQAVAENPSLVTNTLYIFDEFQDFNQAEETLIRNITEDTPGLLLAGDDDQVLYDGLRRGMASIIRGYYRGDEFVTAMLPYCSRCGAHICLAAAHFLAAGRDSDCINKLFLPLKIKPDDAKVRVVAATSPKVGVGWIAKFVAEHDAQIKQRQIDLAAGNEKDPYLLILTPARAMSFLTGGANETLLRLIELYAEASHEPSHDYRLAYDYYDAACYPDQNFAVRKLMAYQDVHQEEIARLLVRGLNEQKPFVALGEDVVLRCLEIASSVKDLVDAGGDHRTMAQELQKVSGVTDVDRLALDLEVMPLGKSGDDYIEGPVLEQSVSSGAVELTTIVGSKGLSADHVAVLGCDDTNLSYVSRNAFFVAMTRARKSLTLLACVGAGGASVLCDYVTSLPDDHVQALYAKAADLVEYASIAALQGQLEKIAYAKKKSAERAREKPS